MAEKTKLALSQAYTYRGRTYGPGEAEVPTAAVDTLQAKERRAKDLLDAGYEPPAPVTPSLAKGELHDPRKRPAAQPAESSPLGNLAQNAVRGPDVLVQSRRPEQDAEDAAAAKKKGGAKGE